MPTIRKISLLQGKLTLQLLPRVAYSAADPTQVETLGVSLERQRGVHAIASDRRLDFDTWPGVLAYTPPGVDVFSESREGGEYLVARWSAGAIPRGRSTSSRRLQVSGHAEALRIGLSLRKQLLMAEADCGGAEELALQFVGLHSTNHSRRRVETKKAYARVLDRIAAEFDQRLTLSEMAAMMDATELHFLRGFGAAVGMTPHAYLIETRLQAARRLLENSEMPLGVIAAECGFSQQAHFGDAFRRTFGLTPREYRRIESRRVFPRVRRVAPE